MIDDAAATGRTRHRRKRWLLAALGIVAAAVCVTVWQLHDRAPTIVERIALEPGALSGWNVLLVSMDTVRRDHVHCYGRQQIDTPVVDELARRGVRFDQAVASMPMTLPSHACMLTGLTPPRHGARVNGMFRLDENATTLGECLQKRGYRTGAAVAAFVLDRRFGLNQGFDRYDDDMTTGRSSFEFSYRERPADQVNEAATAWLRQNADKPFFMFVHYFDPHWPFQAPEPFGSRYKDNEHGDYDGEIAFTDYQLGKLLDVLDELGVRDRTLIIVTSDHGEGLDEHDEKTHSLLMYDTTLRVPLIFSGPSPFPQNRLVTRQVGLIDLMPTILDLLGVPVPPGLDGVSLLKPAEPGPRTLYIETLAPKFLHNWSPLVGLRRDDVKFIFAPKSELYDLRSDPRELKNLYKADFARASTMYDSLKQLVGGDPQFVGRVAANLSVDAETHEKLRQLGYVMTASTPTTTATSQPEALPDPKDVIAAQRWVLQAETLMQTGQNAEAVLLIERFLKDHPDDALALHVAGACYRNLGRWDDCLAAFGRAATHNYNPAAAFAGMAAAYLLMGELEKAEEASQRALKLDASCVQALLTLGLIRTRQERDEEALAFFRRVVEEGRGTFDADARVGIAGLYQKRGKHEQAREELKKALANNPDHRGALTMLSMIVKTRESKDALIAKLRETVKKQPEPQLLLQLGTFENDAGQYEQAAESLHRALELRSDDGEIHYQLARALQKLSRDDEALTYLRQAVRLSPKKAEAFRDLGLILARRNRLNEARDALEWAARVAPKVPNHQYNLGIIRAKLQDLPLAAEAFQRALELDPNHAAAHYNLGIVLQMQGQTEEGQKHLRRAASLDPKLSRTPKAGGQ